MLELQAFQLSLTLPVPWYGAKSSSILAFVRSFPSFTHVCLSPTLEPWEGLRFLVCSPWFRRSQLTSTGGSAPSHPTARCGQRPPALALGLRTLTWTAGALASTHGFGEVVEPALSPSLLLALPSLLLALQAQK